MQFLSYDSENEDGEQVVAVVQTNTTDKLIRGTEVGNDALNADSSELKVYASRWTEASDSSDDEDVVEQHTETEYKQESGLIDANLLLSSMTEKPKFLSRNVGDKFEVSEINRTQHYSSVDDEQKTAARTARPSAVNTRLPNNINRSVPVALQQAANLSSNSRNVPVSTATGASGTTLKKKLEVKDATKETAKVISRRVCTVCTLYIMWTTDELIVHNLHFTLYRIE